MKAESESWGNIWQLCGVCTGVAAADPDEAHAEELRVAGAERVGHRRHALVADRVVCTTSASQTIVRPLPTRAALVGE